MMPLLVACLLMITAAGQSMAATVMVETPAPSQKLLDQQRAFNGVWGKVDEGNGCGQYRDVFGRGWLYWKRVYHYLEFLVGGTVMAITDFKYLESEKNTHMVGTNEFDWKNEVDSEIFKSKVKFWWSRNTLLGRERRLKDGKISNYRLFIDREGKLNVEMSTWGGQCVDKYKKVMGPITIDRIAFLG